MSRAVLTKMLTYNAEQDRRTPVHIFKELDKEFNFQLDPCTSTEQPNNLGTPHYFLYPEKDGLAEDWWPYKSVFVNPPFKNADKWIRKAKLESEMGATVVVFLPSKTDTKWWHDYALKADEIRFVRGRVTFPPHKDPFIIGMAIIVFKASLKGGDV